MPDPFRTFHRLLYRYPQKEGWMSWPQLPGKHTLLSPSMEIQKVQYGCPCPAPGTRTGNKKAVRGCDHRYLRLFCTRRGAAGQRRGRARYISPGQKDVWQLHGVQVLPGSALWPQGRSCHERLH